MSKAFTREDDVPDLPVAAKQPPPLPAGAKNYVTQRGADALRAELARLRDVERPGIVSNADAAGRAEQLRVIDQQIAYLEESLGTAVVVPVPRQPWDVVRFGATATVREGAGQEVKFRIVGVDEADFDRGWISWCAPLARGLIGARLGQRVRVETPEGERELELVGIGYE